MDNGAAYVAASGNHTPFETIWSESDHIGGAWYTYIQMLYEEYSTIRGWCASNIIYFVTWQVFSRAGDIKRIIMGVDKNQLTPYGFAFVVYYTRQDAEDAVITGRGQCSDCRVISVQPLIV